MVDDRTHHVRAVKTSATAAVIVFEVVVEVGTADHSEA